MAGGDRALLFQVPQRLLHEVLLEVEHVRELVGGRRAVGVEVAGEEPVEGGLEALPLHGAHRERRLVEAAAVDEVRPLELPEDLVHRLRLSPQGFRQGLQRPRARRERLRDRLLVGLQAGLLRVQRGVQGDLLRHGPQDPARSPDALHLAGLHELRAPRPEVGERHAGVLEDARRLLLEEIQGADPPEEGQAGNDKMENGKQLQMISINLALVSGEWR